MKTYSHETVQYGIATEELVSKIFLAGGDVPLCTEDERQACEENNECQIQFKNLPEEMKQVVLISERNNESEQESKNRMEALMNLKSSVATNAFKRCNKFTFKNTLQIVQEGRAITPEIMKKYGRKVQQKQGKE